MPGAQDLAISMRCKFMASVLQAAKTRALTCPCFGLTCAEDIGGKRSCGRGVHVDARRAEPTDG